MAIEPDPSRMSSTAVTKIAATPGQRP